MCPMRAPPSVGTDVRAAGWGTALAGAGVGAGCLPGRMAGWQIWQREREAAQGKLLNKFIKFIPVADVVAPSGRHA